MNWKIRILDTVPGFPTTWLRNNAIYLDIEAGPILAKSNGAISDITRIGSEQVAEFNIPFSAVNDFILQRYRKIYTDTSNTIQVYVTLDSAYLPFDILTVVNVDWEAKEYAIQIKLSEEHWISKIENTTLNNLDLGSFEFSDATITNSWSGLPAVSGLFFPLIQYGQLKNKSDGVDITDFRPWIQALWLLDLAFCELGFNFESPFLESVFGRTLFSYILRRDFSYSISAIESRKFSAKLPLTITSTPTYVDEYDPNNLHDAGSYFGVGVFNFFITIAGTTVAPLPNGVVIVMTVEFPDGTKQFFNDFPPDSGVVPFSIEVELNDITIKQGEWLKVSYKAVTSSGTLVPMTITDGIFYNEVIRVIPTQGDIIQINEQVRPDSVLDYFRGIIHIIAGKIDYNPETKTIVLHTQYAADIFGDPIVGYYGGTIQDLTTYQEPDKEAIAINRVEEARYLRVGFKNSSDPVYKEISPENELYSRIVDRGSLFKEKTDPDRNPYFEPTIVKDVHGLHPFFKFPIALGHALDNANNRISYDIGPRLGVAMNYIHVRDGSNSPFKFGTTTYTAIPTIVQEVPNDVTINDLAFVDQNLVYGTRAIDLFSIGWQWESALRKVRRVLNFSLVGWYNLYKQIDFKNLVLFWLDGRIVPSRVEDIQYDDNEGRLIVTAIPERASFDDCADPPGTGAPPGGGQVCNNIPQITITFYSGTGEIDAVADNTLINSTINTDTWEYSTNGGGTWLPYTPGTNLTASVETLFRRSVTYTDGCPDTVVVKTFTPAMECNNSGDILFDYDEGTNTMIATAISSFSSTVSTDTWTVDIDSGGPIAYTPGTPISGFSTLEFVRTVVFTDICPTLIITKDFEAPAVVCNNAPVLGVTELGACLVEPLITGTTSSSIAHTLVQYSYDAGVTWKNWDQNPIEKIDGLKLKATILYCDACSPTCLTYDCP